MRLLLFIGLLISYTSNVKAQDPTTVLSANSIADSLSDIGDIRGAIELYKNMNAYDSANIFEVYNYACALAIDGQVDSAFKYLQIIVGRFFEVGTLFDPNLIHLHSDKRWKEIEEIIAKNTESINGKFGNLYYAEKLWHLAALDQAYYKEINLAEEKVGERNTIVIALWDLKGKINKESVFELEELIKKYGWPKNSDVKKDAARAAFFVIQHSDLNTQKKYISTIKNLCEQKQADWESYALMYDRIQVNENKKQLYGSQVRYNTLTHKHELFPIEDEKNVDIRREKVGLEPLTEYLLFYGIEYSLPK